jgi:hypothetical protein
MQTVRELQKLICHKTELITAAESGTARCERAFSSRRSYTQAELDEGKKGNNK